MEGEVAGWNGAELHRSAQSAAVELRAGGVQAQRTDVADGGCQKNNRQICSRPYFNHSRFLLCSDATQNAPAKHENVQGLHRILPIYDHHQRWNLRGWPFVPGQRARARLRRHGPARRTRSKCGAQRHRAIIAFYGVLRPAATWTPGTFPTRSQPARAERPSSLFLRRTSRWNGSENDACRACFALAHGISAGYLQVETTFVLHELRALERKTHPDHKAKRARSQKRQFRAGGRRPGRVGPGVGHTSPGAAQPPAFSVRRARPRRSGGIVNTRFCRAALPHSTPAHNMHVCVELL